MTLKLNRDKLARPALAYVKPHKLGNDLVCEHQASPLASVFAHRDVECITRFFAAEAPMHLAIHRIDGAAPEDRNYTDLHTHAGEAELNIIIPDATGLTYRIEVADETYLISSNSSIWIPPGVPHSANVVSGSGYFVALRLNDYFHDAVWSHELPAQ